MSSNVNIDELKALRDKFQKIEQTSPEFMEKCVKALTSRMLTLLTKSTPVGQKPELDGSLTQKQKDKAEEIWSGYIGGKLRWGWLTESDSEAETKARNGTPNYGDISKYSNGVLIKKQGDVYSIDIINPVHYASYVEFGHRQLRGRYVPALGKSLSQPFVKGRFFLSKSEAALYAKAPALLEKKIEQWVRGMIK